jgi:hypothetical protein
MSNIYDKKYHEFLKIGFSKEDSIMEIYNLYLDNKPKNTKDLSKEFWSNKLFNIIFEDMVQNELLAKALSKGFYDENIIDISFLEKLFHHQNNTLINALRYSKLFLKLDDKNFNNIKNVFTKHNSNTKFFLACEILNTRANSLNHDIEFSNKELMQYSYIDLLCLISMYMMKYTKENLNQTTYQVNGEVLTQILQERLKEEDRKKKSIDERYILQKQVDKFMSRKGKEYLSHFEKIFNSYREYYYFEKNILSTFCFDDNFKYEVNDNTLDIKVLDIEKYKYWDLNGQKLAELFTYYREEALIGSSKFFSENIFGSKENDTINKIVHLEATETYLLAQEQYGMQDNIEINDNVQISLFILIHQINNLKGLYQKYFIPNYIKHLDNFLDWEKAWEYMLMESMRNNKNRLPLIHQKVNKFSENMVVEEENFTKEDKKNIENFWTIDLKEIYKNKLNAIPNIFEKPLMKVDDYIFIMPYVLGHQNSSASFINSLLKVHLRARHRKDEVSNSENNLSKIFKKTGFKVEAGYNLPMSKEYNIGDVDVICEKDGYLFVLELKSTFIRTDFDNIWKYKTDQLRKASNQLRKREFLINKLLEENNNKFINKFGKPKKVFYWIVDTSFEFDHEYFSNYLKVSMFELIYALNPENDDFYPNGFNIESFIQTIEKAMIWDDLKLNDISEYSINYRVQNTFSLI